jgi:hypothetical protein
MSGDTTAKYTSDWVELGPNDLPQEMFILGRVPLRFLFRVADPDPHYFGNLDPDPH